VSKATGTSQVRYYWDDEDKMVRVEDSVVMNFKVDGLGFRRFKEVVGQYQRWFVYDLGASEVPGLAPLVAEYDGNGNLVAKYHYDGGGLIAMTRNNQSYWYGFEGIGTTRQLMGSQGQVLDAYAFDAWGNELTTSLSHVSNPFKYVGKHGYYLDTESLLMLLGVRYYSANIGRFLSLDPMVDGHQKFLLLKVHLSKRNYLLEINLYSYGYNNPIKNLDFLGLCPIEQCWKCTIKEARPVFLDTDLGLNCECRYKCYLFERKWKPVWRFSLCPPFIRRKCVPENWKPTDHWQWGYSWTKVPPDLDCLGACVARWLKEPQKVISYPKNPWPPCPF